MEKVLDFCIITGESVSKYEGERNYVATGDVVGNKIISFEKVTYKNKPSRANQNVKVGDVLFAKMKDTQKVLIIDEDNVKNIYSTGFFIITPKKEVKSKYLYWLFNSNKFNEQKNKNCKGATQKALNNEGFGKILIKEFPSIKLQEKIVNELDKVQEIIDIKIKQIEELDQLIKSQFVEMFGNPLENNKKWNIDKAINACIKITDGSHFSPKDVLEGIPMLSVKDMRNDGFHYDGCKHISKEDYEILKNQDCIPRMNDVLISKDGSYFYYGFVVEEEKEQAVLSSIAILRPCLEIINPYYLRFYMLSKEIVDMVSRNYVTGAALKRVILKGIKDIPVMIPPIALQNKFAEFVKQIDKQKIEIQNSLEETQKLQDSLMNKYFN